MTGKGVPTPSPYEIYGTYLTEEQAEVNKYVDEQKLLWAERGCTIMCDGWTGPTRLSIINFMVYCGGHTVFWKSVDASNRIKDSRYIYDLLASVIDEVGRENVVQIVTDNGSAYKKAGLEIQNHYDIYWTPCAAHCLDLMFEDVAKRRNIQQTIVEARSITTFIYNSSTMLYNVRQECGGDLVRPGPTRFATNYMAMKSLMDNKAALLRVFTSEWYHNDSISRKPNAKQAQGLVLLTGFWEKVEYALRIYEPMYAAIRLFDSEVYPTLSLTYHTFFKMYNQLLDMRGAQWAAERVKERWDRMMVNVLHKAAYYLHPRFHYTEADNRDGHLGNAVLTVFDHLFPNSPGVDCITTELSIFSDAKGAFGKPAAIAARSKAEPRKSKI